MQRLSISTPTGDDYENDLIKTLEQLEISSVTSRMSSRSSSSTSLQSFSSTGEKQNDIEILLELLLKHMREKFFKQISRYHVGISCDNCGQSDFADDRYKCYVCNDYDLCGKCYEDNQTFKAPHQNNHPMIYFQQPLETSLNTQLNKGLSKGQVHLKFTDYKHQTITCDGCKQFPMKGVRIKCDQCINYDLCYECFTKNVETKGHKLSHKTLIYLLPQRKTFDIDTEVEFLEEKGQYGCFGSVRKARLIPLDKIVACKLIKVQENELGSQTLLKSFMNEMNAYNELRSSKIIKYYGTAVKCEGNIKSFYLFLEYISNGSLESFLEKNKDSVSFRRRFQLLHDVIKGIRRMHQKNYIHKDIKPDNILITEYQSAKIGDMGIAIAHEDNQVGYIIAPQLFAAPELLIQGQKGVFSKSVDIYSFGLLMNYVFTITQHVRVNQKVIFPLISPYFYKLIDKCIQNDPTQRPTIEDIDQIFENFEAFFWQKITSQSAYIKLSTSDKNAVFHKIYSMFPLVNIFYFENYIEYFFINIYLYQTKTDNMRKHRSVLFILFQNFPYYQLLQRKYYIKNI